MSIKTDRLFIRKIVEEDWTGIKNIITDFTQSEYVIYDQPLPTEDQRIKELTKWFADSQLYFAVLLQDSPEMIGYICFHNNDGDYDLGYCFHSAYQGKGYALEGCFEIIKYMKENHKVQVFTAGTALKNIPSCNLLEKLGFVLKGRESLAFHKDEAGNDVTFEGGNFIRSNE